MARPRESLLDGSGTVLATFVRGTRDGHPLADDLEPAAGASIDALMARIRTQLAGHVVGAPVAVGEALVAAGIARPRRRVRLMTLDPQAAAPPTTAPPAGIGIEAATGSESEELLDAFLAAYPPGHPDHRGGSDRASEIEELRPLIIGEMIGPLLACSRIARDSMGTAVGAAVVCGHTGDPPLGGPWVGELFRHPSAPRGTGTALLAAAIAAARADGLRSLGLAVTDGNPALAVYERLGFVVARRAFSVLVSQM